MAYLQGSKRSFHFVRGNIYVLQCGSLEVGGPHVQSTGILYCEGAAEERAHCSVSALLSGL